MILSMRMKISFLLPPKGLQNVPELGVPLCTSGKRKIPNCLNLTSSSLRTGACPQVISPFTYCFFTAPQRRGKKKFKKTFLSPIFSITVALPIHHCSSLDVTLPARTWPLFPEHPPVLYSIFTMQNMDQCSCLAH